MTATDLRPVLAASVSLTAIKSRLRFLACEMRDELRERAMAGEVADDALACFARDAAEVATMLERWEREELRALLAEDRS